MVNVLRQMYQQDSQTSVYTRVRWISSRSLYFIFFNTDTEFRDRLAPLISAVVRTRTRKTTPLRKGLAPSRQIGAIRETNRCVFVAVLALCCLIGHSHFGHTQPTDTRPLSPPTKERAGILDTVKMKVLKDKKDKGEKERENSDGGTTRPRLQTSLTKDQVRIIARSDLGIYWIALPRSRRTRRRRWQSMSYR